MGRRITQIRINPATAEPIPTARRTLSGVAIALFMALRIQAGLAANIKPSSTNRMPKPMRKSANAMDLIGLELPLYCSCLDEGRQKRRPAALGLAYGFAGVSVAVLPLGLLKYRKKSESGRSRKR